MEPAGDSIVLEEEIDPNYEPTEKEVQEYASWLGMDLESEQDLFWIAREGLKAPLPENWKPCKTTDTEEIYYFNFSTGQSTWDHPCDEYYRKVYEDHKKKRTKSRGDTGDGDERKKKEKEDVAELLGKKSGGGKKKKAVLAKATAAEPLGPPVLSRGGLSEKKPLPGLGSGKLNRLSSGNLGGLKPVASLGRLKSEAKNDSAAEEEGEGAEEEEEEVERKPSALHKPPLGSLLTKKPLPSAASAPSLPRADSAAELDALARELAAKKQRLVEDHATSLRELEEEQERKTRKLKAAMEELEEEQDTKLKQRRRELEKKLHEVENQFDKDESSLLRERKDKLKKLESDMEHTLGLKRAELERDQQKELQRLQSKHDAALKELQVKGDAVGELAVATDKLKAAERELGELRGRLERTEEQLREARKRAEEVEKRLAAAEPQKKEEDKCAECERTSRRKEELEAELAEERTRAGERLLALQRELEQATSAAAAAARAEAAEGTEAVVGELRRELARAAAERKQLEEDVATWKSQCGAFEKRLAAEEQRQRSGADGGELAELQEQVASLAKANAQIKEQLLKESIEKRQLHEQLEAATAEADPPRGEEEKGEKEKEELHHKLAIAQRESHAASSRAEELAGRLALREEELRALEQTLRGDRQSAEGERRRLEEELARARSECRQLTADVEVLQRQVSERLATADESQAAAATATRLKWELEQVQGTLRGAQRDKGGLAARVEELQTEMEGIRARAEADREKEAKRREAERDALLSKIKGLEEEAEAQSERVRGATGQEAEARAQLSKLKIKEQAATDQIAQLEEELRGAEGRGAAHQAELERVTRELRVKTSQLEERSSALRSAQGEMETLEEQLQDARRQANEWRTKASASGAAGGGGPGGGGELTELRLHVGEQEARLESLAAEKTQLSDRTRQLTQRLQSAEAAQRSAEEDRDRVGEQLHQATVEGSKWRERLEKKTKEAEQLKLSVATAQTEVEEALQSLSREREEKKDAVTGKTALQKAKVIVEAQVESLNSQVQELEEEKTRAVGEAQSLQSKLRRAESELEAVARELRGAVEDRESLAAKLQTVSSECSAAEAKLRALRSEREEQSKLTADESSRSSEAVRRLEQALEERDARVRKEAEERESQARQLSALRSEREELAAELAATKRKWESAETRTRELEGSASRGDFTLKLRLQQVEAERDRVEQLHKAAEKELTAASEALASCKSELEGARNRVKSLTVEKEEMQQAVLHQSSSSARFASPSSSSSAGGAGEALLVRLQLADVNKSELETHVAELATQLETVTRRCALAEARSKDQSVESEALRTELASVRAAAARMHASALESLPLVERLEYERRKRVLARDFASQLRDFAEREEHALLRSKARVRALHEKQLVELGDELEMRKRRRVEMEEEAERQVLEQLRRERDAKAKELRQRIEAELAEEQRKLEERRQRQGEAMAAAARREEEEDRARQREVRAAEREEELVAEAVEGSGRRSPGQVSRPASESDSESEPPSRRRRPRAKTATPTKHRNTKTKQRRRSRSVGRRHEREVQRWKQRVADEAALLAKAGDAIAAQRRQLSRQAEQLKREKAAWKMEAQHGGGGSGHRAAILHEMKAMLDHSAAQWNATRQHVKQREAWLGERAATLRKMRRALGSLAGKTRRCSRSRGRVRFDSEEEEEGSSDPASSEEEEESDENQDVDSDALLEKLSRLDGELATDASEFSSEDVGRVAAPLYSQSSYRYPLATAPLDGAAYGYTAEPLSLGPRLLTGHSYSSPMPSSRLWPSNATSRLAPIRGGGGLPSDTAVQRRISRWAHGREAMQHAATKQATWLSGLYQEVKAYGDAKAEAAAMAASPVDKT